MLSLVDPLQDSQRPPRIFHVRSHARLSRRLSTCRYLQLKRLAGGAWSTAAAGPTVGAECFNLYR